MYALGVNVLILVKDNGTPGIQSDLPEISNNGMLSKRPVILLLDLLFQ